MSGILRIDPRRPIRITPAGAKRIVLGDTGHGDVSAVSTHAGAKSQSKPLRTRQSPSRWHVAIAHSDRGRLDEHARQAIAAAAILAAPDTGVLAVVLGELHEDLAPLGADRVAVLPELNAAHYQPEARACRGQRNHRCLQTAARLSARQHAGRRRPRPASDYGLCR